MAAPQDVVAGPDGTYLVADTNNHRVRKVVADGTITTMAGTGVSGSGADGGAATDTALQTPAALAVDEAGNVFVADLADHRVRKVDTEGTITTVAGTGVAGSSGDGGPATAARLGSPAGLALGPDGALYVADQDQDRVRRVDPDGTITTVAGDGRSSSAGDGGAATAAGVYGPHGLAFDAQGRLYIAETFGQRVRRVAADGTITTVAGMGVKGFAGDLGPAAEAQLGTPRDLVVDSDGNLYIAESNNHRVRMVTPAGEISTVAGIGEAGDAGDLGLAYWASLDGPRGLGLDGDGNLLVADTFNHRIRLVTDPVPAPAGTEVGRAQATVETDPVGGTLDAADDPAIWVDPADPSRSLLIGTDKLSDTLLVYDLATGNLLQEIPDLNGSLNNVDLRSGMVLGGVATDVVVTSGGDLAFYRVDAAARRLVYAGARNVRPVNGAQGVCLFQDPATGALSAFSTVGSGFMEQFELFDNNGKIDARSVRGPWDVNPADPVVEDGEIEACAVDDEAGKLYVSEQDVAIWEYDAHAGAGTGPSERDMVAGTTWHNAGLLAPDVEGLAVVPQPGGGGWIIASSQGDGTYVVYERSAPHAFVRKFKVADGTVDGCSHTDGIDATPLPAGPGFSHGVFVCQDNNDTVPGTDGNQNFKLVPLERVVPVSGGGTGTTTTTTTTTTSSSTTTTTTTKPSATTTTTAPPPSTTSTTTTSTAPTAPADPDVSGAGGSGAVARPVNGYWMLGGRGAVYPFGQAEALGGPDLPDGWAAVDLEPTPTGKGYWVLDDHGRLSAKGDAVPLGPAAVPVGERATSLSATPTGRGVWVFTDRGRALPLGDARFLGDMSQVVLNGPVLDSVATPTGEGYYMVASDGGIFAFGDARFAGSMGGKRLNAPVESLVPDPDGNGYWLVASDGGVFAFDAPFRGSMGGAPLNRPVTGMVAYGDGYLMVGQDGGIFAFSDRPFLGSLGATPPAVPIAAVAAVPAPR